VTFHLSIYGTGGSLPVSSPERQEFGGATSCYLVERGEQRLILDGGSGLVPLGQTLKQLPQEKIELNLVFSHAHLDHFMGLPFFAPLFDPRFLVKLWSCREALSVPLEATFKTSLDSPFSPLKLEYCRADVQFCDLEIDAAQEIEGFEVSAVPLPHPGGNAGFTLRTETQSLFYSGDFEHGDEQADNCLRRTLEGVDLALLDCTYTPQNYEAHRGFGHPHWAAVGELAKHAKRWLGVHHNHLSDDVTLRQGATAITDAFPNGGLARDLQKVEI